MNLKGKITSGNDQKGFGLVTPVAGDDRVFVHIKAFSNRNRRPEINQDVTYTLSRVWRTVLSSLDMDIGFCKYSLIPMAKDFSRSILSL